MARKARVCPAGITQHVIQRGNNRQFCFSSEADFKAYANWLYEYSLLYEIHVHAWVFMGNHVHLLVTPLQDQAISRMMQSLGRRYVRYFNHRHERTGTLWEGRFKSCLVESGDYVLQCYRYIEMNPVRAGIAANPAEYSWSSFRANACGLDSRLVTPHEEYLALGNSVSDRQRNYHSFFEKQQTQGLLEEIGESVNRGVAFGSESFKDEMEQSLGRRVRTGLPGRPKKEI